MPERISLYLDEHISRTIARGLQSRGVDVIRVPEAGTMGASDREHLEWARREGRVLFTHDADFLRLHALEFSHDGIIFAPRRLPVGRAIRGLMLIYELLSAEDMRNHVEFV